MVAVVGGIGSDGDGDDFSCKLTETHGGNGHIEKIENGKNLSPHHHIKTAPSHPKPRHNQTSHTHPVAQLHRAFPLGGHLVQQVVGYFVRVHQKFVWSDHVVVGHIH